MSLAISREKRANAGSKMAQLLNNEEEDEFYATCYGGFAEAEDDKEFVERAEDHEEDYVDSDFDIDEDEEQKENDNNEEEGEPKRKRPSRGVFTKAYKVRCIPYPEPYFESYLEVGI
jgi:vacuolar protein sorting-associated protein 72